MEPAYRKKRSDHIFYRYVIKVRNRLDETIASLAGMGIEAKRPVFKPLHHYMGLSGADFPNAEEAYDSVLSIPMYPSLGRDEAEFIARTAGEIVLENDFSRTSA
jgi:dTDP-4-amino-4,6-dideoxygalactose transaminase